MGSKLHGNHFDREGKVFRWDNLPADGGPGWPIGCRCYAEPVINLDKLDLVEVSTPTMEAVEEQAPKPMTKAQPEPFPGYKAKYDAYLAKLVAQDEDKAAVQAKYAAGEIGKEEFDALMLKMKKQALSIKSSISKLKAQGLKAGAKKAPVTTAPVEVAKPAEKPQLVAKTKPTPVEKPKSVEKPESKVNAKMHAAVQKALQYLAGTPGTYALLGGLTYKTLSVMRSVLETHKANLEYYSLDNAEVAHAHAKILDRIEKVDLKLADKAQAQKAQAAEAEKSSKTGPKTTAAESSKYLETKEK